MAFLGIFAQETFCYFKVTKYFYKKWFKNKVQKKYFYIRNRYKLSSLVIVPLPRVYMKYMKERWIYGDLWN
jgi:hypothetical protein